MRRVTRHSPLPFYFQQVAASFALLALFFALPLFVFNRLQLLFAKYPGYGYPRMLLVGRVARNALRETFLRPLSYINGSTCRGGPPSVGSVKCPVWEGETSP
jgi:hypothetical protein